MIGKIISHYEILEKLGEGGMGVVYKARDMKLDRFVALKFLPPGVTRDHSAKQRFVQEAKAASTLQHPNICVVYDIDETPDAQTFISMEYLESETLEEAIRHGSLKIEQALDLSIQIAQGLAEAHHHGIVHRDIKPANILLTKRGAAKIVDFGLAKLATQTALTRPGVAVGTAAYMSPEQSTGNPVDERTDIWSLGVVLYEMIAGRRPFAGEYDNAILYSILNVQPEPISAIRTGVPTDLDPVVRRCLAKEPRERYQHVDELLADLHSCLKGTSPLPARRPLHRTPGWGRITQLALVGAGAIVLGILAYVLFPRISPTPPRLKKIAVLPFENLGPSEDEFFADGLTNEITSRLSSIHGLGVISRTSSMQYKKTSKTLPVVGKELGVDYVLEGTIRWEKVGESQRIRITPELIQISGDVHLWADNFDRTLDDIFAVQTEISTTVVKYLDIVLGESESRAINTIPTKNLEAYETYLRGLSYSSRFERPNLEMALEMFGHAVKLDSSFAVAYAEMSMAHLLMYWFGFDHTSERFAMAKEALDRAFALRRDLPEAYLALGYVYLFATRDYAKARESFESAERMLPNNSRALEALAYVSRREGSFETAIKQLKQSFELDPQNANLPLEIGNTLRMLGEYSDAERYLDQSISLLPDQTVAYVLEAEIDLLWHGDTKKSRSNLERIPAQYRPWLNFLWLDIYDRAYQSALNRLTQVPEAVHEDDFSVIPVSLLRGMVFRFMNDPLHSRTSFDSARTYLEVEARKRPEDHRIHSSLGIVYAGLGQKDAAIREADLAAGQLPLSRDAWAGVIPAVTQAQVYTMAGKYDEAVDRLDTLLSTPASREITPHILRLDPTYDPLRGNPRFLSLLAKYGSP
jgi:serine/threonine protein kinase/tetratricopeptide (TPR) repeat protein